MNHHSIPPPPPPWPPMDDTPFGGTRRPVWPVVALIGLVTIVAVLIVWAWVIP